MDFNDLDGIAFAPPDMPTDPLRRVLAIWHWQEDAHRGRPGTNLRTYLDHALQAECAAVAGTAVGTGLNDQLAKSAFSVGTLVQPDGLTVEEAYSALLVAAQQAGANDPPKDQGTIRRQLDAGMKKPRNLNSIGAGLTNGSVNGKSVAPGIPPKNAPEPEPWEPPIPFDEEIPPDPFPLAVLPEGLQRFVVEGAWALNCPPDFLALPVIVAAGACMGNSVRLLITNSHSQGAVLFAGIVGLASSGKSPALELVLEPLEAAQHRFYLDWQLAKEEAKKDESAPKPVLRQILADDATTEALARLLEKNPRGVLMVLDEIAALVSGLNQYKQGGGNDRQFYLRLWPQATVRVHRSKHEDGVPTVIRRPFTGIAGGIQPSVIAAMRSELERGRGPIEDGWLDRWLWGYPAAMPAVGEQWREVSDEAKLVWDQSVTNLLALPMKTAENGEQRPHYLGLNASGKHAWETFTAAHATELNDPHFPAHLSGPWGKLRGYCGRLALILHLLREACGESVPAAVDGVSMNRAADLVGYFKSHARRVYKALGTDPRIIEARKVLSWLMGWDRPIVSRRDIWRGLRKSFSKPEDLTAPLKLLQHLHYLRWVEPAYSGTGRFPTPTWEINPYFQDQGATGDRTHTN